MATHTQEWLAQPASWAREQGWRSRLSRHGSGLHSPAGGEGCSGGSPLHASRSTRAHEERTGRHGGGGRQRKTEQNREKDRQRNGMNRQQKSRYESKSYKGWDGHGSTWQRCVNSKTMVLVSGVSRCCFLEGSSLWSDPYRTRMSLIIWTHLNSPSIQVEVGAEVSSPGAVWWIFNLYITYRGETGWNMNVKCARACVVEFDPGLPNRAECPSPRGKRW